MVSDGVQAALKGLYDRIPDVTKEEAYSAQMVCAGIIRDEDQLSEVLRMLGLKP